MFIPGESLAGSCGTWTRAQGPADRATAWYLSHLPGVGSGGAVCAAESAQIGAIGPWQCDPHQAVPVISQQESEAGVYAELVAPQVGMETAAVRERQ